MPAVKDLRIEDLITFEELPPSIKELISRNTAEAWRSAYSAEFDNIERLSLVEWQEKHRTLPTDAAESGRMKITRTPYLIEIADALDSRDPDKKTVVVKKAAQLGLTELGVSFIGKTIHNSPDSIILFGETAEKARRLMKGRVIPMLKTTAFVGLLGKLTQSEMLYPGGMLSTFGANSPASFSSTSAAIVILDEYARYNSNIGGEGSPYSLVRARVSTYGRRAKIYIPSTPLDGDATEGKLEAIYQSGDCREYYIPCPHCGHMDYMRSDRFDMETASVVCVECGELGGEVEYKRGIDKGEWRPTKEKDSYDVVSFRVSGLVAPLGWQSWRDIAQDLKDVQAGRTTKQAIYNTRFGEDWEDEVEMPVLSALRELHEAKRDKGSVPDGVVFLTMAVDTQQGWFVWEVAGWGENMTKHSINHGKVAYDITSAEGRKELESLINGKWGDREIDVCCIDSGDGRVTSHIYDFVSTYPQPVLFNSGIYKVTDKRTVVACKGGSKLDPSNIIERHSAVSRQKAKKSKVNVWIIGTSLAKRELYNSLTYREGNMRYRVTYPQGYHDYWYEELVSEKPVATRTAQGKKVIRFIAKNKVRNEGLDLHVLNRAAAHLMGADEWSDRKWRQLADKTSGKEPERKKKTRKTAYKYL